MTDPAWLKYHGAKRIQAEFKSVTEHASSGTSPIINNLRVVGDNLFQWQFEVKGFDEDLEGGRQLNQDLEELGRSRRQDYLLMEIRFPAAYPTEPFMLRVISPRCRWYTGHVTAGGSICIESLTLSGTAGSWQPSFSVESILQVVFLNMLDCEQVWVETRSGPGGLSGPLRVDLLCQYCGDVLQPYSLHEAQAAFHRMMDHHRRSGWGHGAQDKVAAAAAAGPSGSGGGGGGGGRGGWHQQGQASGSSPPAPSPPLLHPAKARPRGGNKRGTGHPSQSPQLAAAEAPADHSDAREEEEATAQPAATGSRHSRRLAAAAAAPSAAAQVPSKKRRRR